MNPVSPVPGLPENPSHANVSTPSTRNERELRSSALSLLAQTDVRSKTEGVRQLASAWQDDIVGLDCVKALKPTGILPGRPAAPQLVPPLQVPQRSMNTVEGRAALIHALAHIEFNAVNLALDAIWRFAGMPDAYYADWLQIADEEALHFTLLANHLRQSGFAYGDFPAHDGLWEMAEKTSEDILARMALVPRTREARGLDASPSIRSRLFQAGDRDAAAILDIILRDEIGHVAIGNRWYAWLCRWQGRDPVHAYRELARKHRAPQLRGPFNLAARRAAGFTDEELELLQQTSFATIDTTRK